MNITKFFFNLAVSQQHCYLCGYALPNVGQRIKYRYPARFQTRAAVVTMSNQYTLYPHRIRHLMVVQGVTDKQDIGGIQIKGANILQSVFHFS